MMEDVSTCVVRRKLSDASSRLNGEIAALKIHRVAGLFGSCFFGNFFQIVIGTSEEFSLEFFVIRVVFFRTFHRAHP